MSTFSKYLTVSPLDFSDEASDAVLPLLAEKEKNFSLIFENDE